MRYTTIIDIRDIPAIWNNANCSRVYLYMCLAAGWQDYNRDIVSISIRQLAGSCRITPAAARNALVQLEKAGLIRKSAGSIYMVVKWIAEMTVTPRNKTQRQQQAAEAEARRQEEARLRDQEREKAAENVRKLRARGKTPFMVYYEDLEKKAAAGDIEAINLVKRHRESYESHCAAIKEEQEQSKQLK